MHVADTFNHIKIIRLLINSSIYFIIIRREPSLAQIATLIHYFRLSQHNCGYDESFSDSANCREKSSQALL